MSINAIIDGTTYEGVETIMVGGKTIMLSEVESGGGGGDEPIVEYPTISFFKGANVGISNGKLAAVGGDNRRAFAYITEQVNGGLKYINTGTTIANFPTNAYPLYIPEGATKVTVACASNLKCAINCHKDVNGTTVTAVDNGYWSELGGETNYDLSTFIASGATHISIGFATSDNASLDNITVDSTTVQISFS